MRRVKREGTRKKSAEAVLVADLEVAKRVGKEGFPSLRQQFIYSRENLTIQQLAIIWDTSVETIYSQMKRSKAAGDDWNELRVHHLESVAHAITLLTRENAELDARSAIASFKTMTSACYHLLMGHIVHQRNLPMLAKEGEATQDVDVVLKVLRGADLAVDIWDRLTGTTVAREVYQARVDELEFLAAIVKQHVSDPEIVREIARVMSLRRAMARNGASRRYIDVAAASRDVPLQAEGTRRAIESLDD